MKKIIVLSILLMILTLYLPNSTAETSMNSGPELETSINSGLQLFIFEIYVENVGDETAHNVSLTEVSVEGNVIVNFQQSTVWSEDLPPGELTILDPNSMAVGFGKFSLSMTVSCDEGSSSISTVDGLIIGPVFFIP